MTASPLPNSFPSTRETLRRTLSPPTLNSSAQSSPVPFRVSNCVVLHSGSYLVCFSRSPFLDSLINFSASATP
ncbi:unnamed protein product [Rhodiola kirilowii]